MSTDSPFPVEIEDLDHIDVSEVASVVQALVKKFASDLDLEGVVEVRLTGDLPETLRRFSDEHGTHYHHTSNPMGVGVAQAYRRAIDGKFSHHILLNRETSEMLCSVDDTEFTRGAYVLLHELCHVDDSNRITKAKPKGWLAPAKNHKSLILSDLAIGCWSEYYADRRSGAISVLMGQLILEALTGAVVQVKDIIRKSLIEYRTDGDLNKFFLLTISCTRTLLQQMAHFLGYLDATRDRGGDHTTLRGIEDNLMLVLEEIGFAWIMKRMGDELRALWTSYPEWGDIHSVFEGLIELTEEVFASFNVILHDQGDSVYVELPLTPETCPSWPPPGW